MDVASRFVDLLSKNNVQSRKSVQHAESIFKGRQRKKTIEDTLPEAWNKIVTDPSTLLLDLIDETTEKLCGFKPETEEAARFLKHYEDQFFLSPKIEEKISKKESTKLATCNDPNKRSSTRSRRTNSGKVLNLEWGVGARHSLYSKDGKFYMPPNQFPVALFDPNGYVLFKTKESFLSCKYIKVGKRVNVTGGINSIPQYKKMR